MAAAIIKVDGVSWTINRSRQHKSPSPLGSSTVGSAADNDAAGGIPKKRYLAFVPIRGNFS
jgi:hypothetical protein